MSRKKKHIWHCADGFPAKVTKGAKGTKYIIDPRNGQLIAYFNVLPLLAAAAVPSIIEAGVSMFKGGDKGGSKGEISSAPQMAGASEQYFKNKYTAQERVHDALRR